MEDRRAENPDPDASHAPGTRRIVVHAALCGGEPRLFALSAAGALRAVAEIEAALEGEATGPWEVVEQEVDVSVVPVTIEADDDDDGTVLRWACPACGAAWRDTFGPEDELPVLLLCDCGGTANTWCLGTRG